MNFQQELTDLLEHIKTILVAKNHDYNGQGTPFKTFETQGKILNMPPEKAILSRLLDKVTRIGTLLENPNKVNESIEDSCLDLLGYAILLNLYRRTNKD